MCRGVGKKRTVVSWQSSFYLIGLWPDSDAFAAQDPALQDSYHLMQGMEEAYGKRLIGKKEASNLRIYVQ